VWAPYIIPRYSSEEYGYHNYDLGFGEDKKDNTPIEVSLVTTIIKWHLKSGIDYLLSQLHSYHPMICSDSSEIYY